MQVLQFYQFKGLVYKSATEGGVDRMLLAAAVYDTSLTPMQVINWLKMQRCGRQYASNPRMLDAQTVHVEEKNLKLQVAQMRAAAAAEQRRVRRMLKTKESNQHNLSSGGSRLRHMSKGSVSRDRSISLRSSRGNTRSNCHQNSNTQSMGRSIDSTVLSNMSKVQQQPLR